LINYFENVKSSDINGNQIKSGFKHNNIEYSVQNSEKTNYKDLSFDIVCVAQALHWFSSDKYYKEVNRILKEDGIFACWGYSFFKINNEIDKLINETIFDPILPYWAEENKLLWNNYSEIDFPFEKIEVPEIKMIETWNKIELVEYIKTWSAYKRFIDNNNNDIISNFLDTISGIWKDNEKLEVKMDFTLYCGKK